MAEWKTLKQETIEIGSNNFIEVTLKQPPEGDNVLVGLTKGWYNQDKEKRYKANILFSKEKVQEVLEALKKITE